MTTPRLKEDWKNPYKGSTTRETVAEMNHRRVQAIKAENAYMRERATIRLRNSTPISATRGTISLQRQEPPSGAASVNLATTTSASTIRGVGDTGKKSSLLTRPSTPGRSSTRFNTSKKSPRVSTTTRTGNMAMAGNSSSSVVAAAAGAPTTPITPTVLPTVPPLQLSPSVGSASVNIDPRIQVKSEMSRHNVPFTLTGPYACVALVKASASIWAANSELGTIDIFSSVSGELSVQIPARVSKKKETIKPLALLSTPHHVWVGFSDGAVVVYDHLCVTQVTMGHFHASPVVAFCSMMDGTTVSGSLDMALVRWDKEEKNFEAITRIVGVSETHQALTCMTAFGANIVLCGSMAGSILAVDCTSGLQVATLRGHNSRVNAMVVMEDLLFSAAEDGYVNVWNMRCDEQSSGLAFQRSCRLLKCVPVQVAVRDMVPHEGSRSLWVSYVDGVVERWSANPDDDFGVEQVAREAFIDANGSYQPYEVVSLHCIGTVEAMRVLALGSNGISKVWCGHRNVLEESLQKSIKDINAVISQDSAEAKEWEQKALALKQKEVERKGKYSTLLSRLHVRRLLFSYYSRWRMRVCSHRLRGRQQEEICLNLEERYQFRLMRRYFTTWCSFYDKEQSRIRKQLIALALERVTNQMWIAELISRWRDSISRRKLHRQQEEVMKTLERVSNGVILAKYFACWKCQRSIQRGKLPADKLALVAAKSRQRVLRQAYDSWYASNTQCKPNSNITTTPATTTTIMSSNDNNTTSKSLVNNRVSKTTYIGRFAGAYVKVTEERERRRVFGLWRRWNERRRIMLSRRALAAAKEKQCYRDILYRRFVTWQLFCRKRALDALLREVQEVEAQLRHAEETHSDIFDKLQLQKRLDHLRRQYEQEKQRLNEDVQKTQKLTESRDSLRRSLEGVSGVSGSHLDDESLTASSNALFTPSVLRQLPVAEAMALVMTRLKGIVLNIYTDMPLFRQIKDRLRCGTTAAVVFLEGFQEVKRLIVNISKRPVGATWRSGERWPVTNETLENLPLHPCAAVVQAIKAMVVAYDMVGASDIESVTATREEIVANADLLFLLWRVCYTARKPPLPVNNRVNARA
ncbi:uncharacterized protein TM35_000361920 [Trypanosoma theileri]|uniref:Uncharacterized protein n=1 Tax=Trypanosoma theileri TaxID=67003 RepID=A0A1X0NKN7_9TRYP|nr:uncharacterized protein TM35_000361920 [Trypanosoma theileri]ORC85332.1 hypothetical protein TM35_000361920 [Trypanosoma theileri]